MVRRPPNMTRPNTFLPCPTLFRYCEHGGSVDPRFGLAGTVLPTAVACDAQFHRLLQAEHPARQPAAGREHSGIEIEAVAVRLGVEDEGEPVVPVAQFCRKLDQHPSRAHDGLANDAAASRIDRDPGATPTAVDL